MSNSTHDMFEILVRHLDNELLPEEKVGMEEQLAKNPLLKAQLEDLNLSREAIRFHGIQQQVASVRAEMSGKSLAPVVPLHPRRRNYRYFIGIAALLILLIGGYFLYNSMTLSAEKVFASHYQKYELVTARDNNPETPMEAAYRAKNYAEVLRIHNAGEDNTAKGEFLCGAASLETRDNNKAIKCFNEVFDLGPDKLLKEETEFYLSLAYVRNKEYEKALELLDTIKADADHLYHDKATSGLIRQVSKLNSR